MFFQLKFPNIIFRNNDHRGYRAQSKLSCRRLLSRPRRFTYRGP